MRIGIDLGGSHIAIGLIDQEKIIKKYEYNFSSEEKEDTNILHKILEEKIKIQMVGICAPRYI